MADYTAYEVVTGRALQGVESLCRHLTEAGSFNDETNPTNTDICRELTLAYAKIAGHLAARGYATDQTNSVVLGILERLNVLEVAIYAELANPITGEGEPNQRFKALQAERDSYLEMIESQALGVLGATGVSATVLQIGVSGQSLSGKRTVSEDSDNPPAAFTRGFGRNRRATADRSYGDADYYPESVS